MFAKYKGDSLQKIIYKKVLRINTENICPADQLSNFKQADHEKIIVDQSGINYFELILYFLGIILMTCALHVDKKTIVAYIFVGILNSFFLALIINSLRDMKKVFIFNRKDGTITYPTFWFRSETVPFSQATIIRGKSGFRSGIPIGLAFISQNRRFRSYIHYDFTYAMLSLYVWYMDKNRPLPPGTAFDAYREVDYLRRRSEGFPHPLYASAIETPEWEGATTKYHDTDAAKRGFINYDVNLGATACQIELEIPDENGLMYKP